LGLFELDKSEVRLTPGGLRGGAAVRMYRENIPIPEILWSLRLRQQSTLEFYLQEVGTLTVFSKISSDSLGLLIILSIYLFSGSVVISGSIVVNFYPKNW